jgi:hypothetical protein
MTDISSLIEKIQSYQSTGNYLRLSGEEISSLGPAGLRRLADACGHSSFITLPSSEQRFFEWMRRHDEKTWLDLWGGDAALPPYVVSVSNLLYLSVERRGFPVCDLESVPNYYFTAKHIREDGGKQFIEAAKARAADGEQLSLEELFMLEVAEAPIDIWRFAYTYAMGLADALEMVHALIADEVLTHTPTRDELSPYLLEEAQ